MSKSKQSTKKRRWKVETYHKLIKSNASRAKFPGKTPRTQVNHLFASLCAYIRLESLTKLTGNNHFALKQKIYIEALKTAMRELQKLIMQTILQTGDQASAPA